MSNPGEMILRSKGLPTEILNRDSVCRATTGKSSGSAKNTTSINRLKTFESLQCHL